MDSAAFGCHPPLHELTMQIRSYVPTTTDRPSQELLPPINQESNGNPPRPQQEHPRQRPDPAAAPSPDATLSLQTGAQPLVLMLKVTADTIISVFELHERPPAPLPGGDATLDSAAAQVVGLLARAFHTFKIRFSDSDSEQATDQFVVLAQQALDEALTEVQSVLALLRSDAGTLDTLLEDFRSRLRQGLERVVARIIL